MKILPILLLFVFNISFGQSYTFSYNDPCTGILKSLVVPANGITVSYYGQINTFNPLDFQNGSFQAWADNIKSSYGGLNPCATIVGLSSSLDVAQSSALNTLGIINSLSSIADIASSMSGSLNTTGSIGSINNSTGTKSDNKEENKKNNSSSGGNSQGGANSSESQSSQGSQTEGSTSQGSQTETSTPQGSSSESQSSQGSQTEGSSPNEANGEKPNTETSTKEEEGKSNVVGGTAKSIQRSTEKNGGNAPTIVLSSDFAGFNFKDNDVNFGLKGSGGFTSVRWDGKRTHGVMVDYTSAMNGPNITAFYGFLGEKRIDLISVTGSFGFTGFGSKYATLAFGQMWNFKKPKNFKLIYMLTGSFGEISREPFIGTASIVGAMYDLKVARRIDIKLTNLFIYAPFVSYYDDVVLNSPFVIMPLVGANVGVTKKFKVSVNFGGTYAINKNVMNFTVMFGTRIGL